MRRIIVTCILSCLAMCLSAQNSGLFTHTRGYFIKNGDSWEEYLTSSRTGRWSSYSQYSEDANYYYISNSSCSVAVPKTSANCFYLRNGDDWDIVYQTRRVYGAFNDSGRDLYCHENGYFVRDGNAWRLYLPEKRSGVWASFTTYREDDNFYYVSNSNDKMAIPKESANSFYLAGSDGEWNKSYTDTDIYFGGTSSSDGSSPSAVISTAEALDRAYNYYWGKNGYAQDYAQAFKYYKQAADAGHSKAKYMTGLMYDFGQGVEKDETAAFTYVKRAADDEVQDSYCKLALMYANGCGTEKDEAAAFRYASMSASAGEADGMSLLARLYYGGLGVGQDNSMAFYYADKAARAGDDDAQAFLGKLYYKGAGVSLNYNTAVYWIEKAVANDNVDGMILLSRCCFNGFGTAKDEDRARELYLKADERYDEISKFFTEDYDTMYAMFEDDDDDDFWWWLW